MRQYVAHPDFREIKTVREGDERHKPVTEADYVLGSDQRRGGEALSAAQRDDVSGGFADAETRPGRAGRLPRLPQAPSETHGARGYRTTTAGKLHGSQGRFALQFLYPSVMSITNLSLGPVDGFDQDQHASEANNGRIAFSGLFTAHRDPFKSFQFAHCLFDAGSRFV